MNCPRCNTTQPDESAFCNKCGVAVSSKATSPLASNIPKPDEPEQELWQGRMSGKALAHLWLVWLLWTILLMTLYLAAVKEWHRFFGYGILGLILVPVPYILGKWIYGTLAIKYRLTTHRFFKNVGILSRKINELELIRVDDVSVEQNVIQRLFDVGVITLLSTDATDPRLVIYGVDSPIPLKEKIREHVRKRRERSLHVESL